MALGIPSFARRVHIPPTSVRSTDRNKIERKELVSEQNVIYLPGKRL